MNNIFPFVFLITKEVLKIPGFSMTNINPSCRNICNLILIPEDPSFVGMKKSMTKSGYLKVAIPNKRYSRSLSCRGTRHLFVIPEDPSFVGMKKKHDKEWVFKSNNSK